jgi:DNA invertase Pin-like site-specific DNA recombinase
MDAFIYIRFSTPRQENGSSKDRQLEACRAFIKAKGWTEAGIIEDLGRSAWKGNHLTKGNLGKFAKRVFGSEFEPGKTVLVVENLDRLSRQRARITQRWVEDVCDAGMAIAHIAGNKVYDADNLSENLLSILEVLFIAEGANRYVENLSTRSKGSYEARLKQARIDNTAIGTIGPAWLKAVGKRPNVKWEPVPERVQIVHEIFDMTLAGKAPWAIAREFNQRREPSFTGIKWERTSIVKIIRNPAIEGDRVIGEGKMSAPTGEVLFGYYGDATIAPDVVAQARAMLDRRRRGSGRNSGVINNLFGQAVRCGECGGRMMTTGYQSRYLTCYDSQRGSGCSQRTAFRYRPFEAAALDSILHLALDETFFRQAEKISHTRLDVAVVEKAIRDKMAKTEMLVDMLSRIKSPTTERSLVVLEEEIADLKAKLADLNAKMAAAQGVASAEIHLARVHGVKDAVTHPDDDVRLPARLRVSEALRAIEAKAVCRLVGGQKEFLLTVMDRMAAFRISNDGEIIGKADFMEYASEAYDRLSEPERAEIMKALEGQKVDEKISKIVKRVLR